MTKNDLIKKYDARLFNINQRLELDHQLPKWNRMGAQLRMMVESSGYKLVEIIKDLQQLSEPIPTDNK